MAITPRPLPPQVNPKPAPISGRPIARQAIDVTNAIALLLEHGIINQSQATSFKAQFRTDNQVEIDGMIADIENQIISVPPVAIPVGSSAEVVELLEQENQERTLRVEMLTNNIRLLQNI